LSSVYEAILAAREARYREQVALAASGNGVVVTINLNLPGGSARYAWAGLALDEAAAEVARTVAARGWGFTGARRAADAAGQYLVAAVTVSGSESAPGREDSPMPGSMQVKHALVLLEEGHPRGRLWDIDVLDRDGRPLSRAEAGQSPRRCFVCGAPAHECRVLKRHSLEETSLAAETIYLGPIVDEVLAGATAGMLLEAAAWPSPGLVSPYDTGAHEDMNYLTFLLSASSVVPRLRRMVECGRDFTLGRCEDASLLDLFRLARAAGVHVEEAMLGATSGANTHRGTIFALGMASVAATVAWGRAALLGSSTRPAPADISVTLAGMTRGLVATELETLVKSGSALTRPALTRGQRLYLETGCTGIRGEVERGLPTVISAGLPAFKQVLDRSGLGAALVHSLISIMAVADDSALAGRHSVEVLREFVQPCARDVLAAGSVFSEAGRSKIVEMQRVFAERRLNPGGSGDLLAVTVAVYCWENGTFTRDQVLKPASW